MATMALAAFEMGLGVLSFMYAWQTGEGSLLASGGACILLAGISLGVLEGRKALALAHPDRRGRHPLRPRRNWGRRWAGRQLGSSGAVLLGPRASHLNRPHLTG